MGISIKELRRRVTIAAGVALVMIVASVPAFSQYRYDRSRSINRRGSGIGLVLRLGGARRRPVIYGRSNRYYRSNDYYYRGRSYGYHNYYRSDRNRHWRGRGWGHYRSNGRGYRNW
jgi:hypothetical protein